MTEIEKDYAMAILLPLEALRDCKGECKGCPVQYQDEGDNRAWCGHYQVLEKATYYLRKLIDEK